MKTNKFLAGATIAFLTITLLFIALSLSAQERVEVLGDFENWNTKQIKESSLIGGQTKTLYKLGGTWDCSNAHAKAMGVDKVSVSVRPEKRGEGTCCRMESTLETVSAIGINFKALATGAIYTGKMIDVVGMKQSSDPNSAIDMGVPFTGRPSALILDYKALIQNRQPSMPLRRRTSKPLKAVTPDRSHSSSNTAGKRTGMCMHTAWVPSRRKSPSPPSGRTTSVCRYSTASPPWLSPMTATRRTTAKARWYASKRWTTALTPSRRISSFRSRQAVWHRLPVAQAIPCG